MKNDNPSSNRRINEKQDHKFLLLLKRLVEVYGRLGGTQELLYQTPRRHIADVGISRRHSHENHNHSCIFLYKNESSVKSRSDSKFSGPCVRTTYFSSRNTSTNVCMSQQSFGSHTYKDLEVLPISYPEDRSSMHLCETSIELYCFVYQATVFLLLKSDHSLCWILIIRGVRQLGQWMKSGDPENQAEECRKYSLFKPLDQNSREFNIV